MNQRAGGAKIGWDIDPRAPRALFFCCACSQGGDRYAALPWANMVPRFQR